MGDRCPRCSAARVTGMAVASGVTYQCGTWVRASHIQSIGPKCWLPKSDAHG